MFYSKQTGGFYATEIHGDAIPGDAVEITTEYHQELLAGQDAGQVIQPDSKGYPRLADRPEPTVQELQKIQNSKARQYLRETDWYVARFAETGVAIPDDIKQARADARASVVE